MALQNAFAALATDKPDLVTSKDLTGTTVTGTYASQGIGELIVQVPTGYATFSIRKATGSATIVFEHMLIGGTSWDAVVMARADGVAAASATSGGTTSVETWVGDIPPGTLYLRARASVWATTSTIRLGLSPAAYDPTPSTYVSGGTLNAILATGSAAIGNLGASFQVIGAVRKAGVWYDESITVPAASGTITGANRDLYAAASTVTATAGFPDNFRMISISDQNHTLYGEISRDNTTYRRVAKATAVQVETGGLWVASIDTKPVVRYARGLIVMGTTAPSLSQLTTAAFG